MKLKKLTKHEHKLLNNIKKDIKYLSFNTRDVTFLNSIDDNRELTIKEFNRLLQILNLVVDKSSFVYIFKIESDHIIEKVGKDLIIDNQDYMSQSLITSTYKLLMSLNNKLKIDVTTNAIIRNLFFTTILSKKFRKIHFNTKTNGQDMRIFQVNRGNFVDTNNKIIPKTLMPEVANNYDLMLKQDATYNPKLPTPKVLYQNIENKNTISENLLETISKILNKVLAFSTDDIKNTDDSQYGAYDVFVLIFMINSFMTLYEFF